MTFISTINARLADNSGKQFDMEIVIELNILYVLKLFKSFGCSTGLN